LPIFGDHLADELGGGSVSILKFRRLLERSSDSRAGGDRHFHWFAEGRNSPAGQKAGRQSGVYVAIRCPASTFFGSAEQPVLRAHEAGGRDSAEAPDRRLGERLSQRLSVR
jgi:hypothetical protein